MRDSANISMSRPKRDSAFKQFIGFRVHGFAVLVNVKANGRGLNQAHKGF